jgi:hypothetical protein
MGERGRKSYIYGAGNKFITRNMYYESLQCGGISGAPWMQSLHEGEKVTPER